MIATVDCKILKGFNLAYKFGVSQIREPWVYLSADSAASQLQGALQHVHHGHKHAFYHRSYSYAPTPPVPAIILINQNQTS